jgi:hypothetical protein
MSFMSPPPPGTGTDDDLPPADTARWVPRRKAAVVKAIADGRISLEEACARWNLSMEEINLWQRAMRQIGVHGLRVTRVQIYRPLFQHDGEIGNN